MTLLDTATVAVTLDADEREMGECEGFKRQRDNIRAGLRNAHGLAGAGWNEHIEGACAEVAVAKHLNFFWCRGKRGAGDVGAYQVRYTTMNPPMLRLHSKDADDAVFILVYGGPFEYTLAGWCPGWAGKARRYWSDPTGKNRPAFFVPVRDLSPMSDLPAL